MPTTRRSTPATAPVEPANCLNKPLATLRASHDQMRRSRDSLHRMCDHLAQGGAVAQIQGAAREVLAYFDEAALQHHEDEERHVFPRVLEHTRDPDVRAAVLRLQEEHLAMEGHWAALRSAIVGLAAGHASAFRSFHIATARSFAELYVNHASIEETVVFPVAASLFDEAALQAMGEEMATRRGGRPATG